VHGNHHLLVTIHAGRFSIRSVMIVEVWRHVLVDDRSICPVNEFLEVVSNKLLHSIRCQLGSDGSLLKENVL
jgi:hypothetical protein